MRINPENREVLNPMATLENAAYGAIDIAGVHGFAPEGTLMFPTYASLGSGLQNNNPSLEENLLTEDISNRWDEILRWFHALNEEDKGKYLQYIIENGSKAYTNLLTTYMGMSEEDASSFVKDTAYRIIATRWNDYKNINILPNLAVTAGLEGTLDDAKVLSARIDWSLSVLQLLMQGKAGAEKLMHSQRFVKSGFDWDDIGLSPYARNNAQASEASAEDNTERAPYNEPYNENTIEAGNGQESAENNV